LEILNQGSILANADRTEVESGVATALSFPTAPARKASILVGSVPNVIHMALRPTAKKLYHGSVRLQTHDPAVAPAGHIHIAVWLRGGHTESQYRLGSFSIGLAAWQELRSQELR
jgi:hypothetical protein